MTLRSIGLVCPFVDLRTMTFELQGASGDRIGGSVAGSTGIYPLLLTGSLLAIVPLIVAFLFLQRFWQSGLSAGGVKQ